MKKTRSSKRLQTLATYVPKGAYFADIGTDHAYLACHICLQDQEARGIASDVNEGPLEAARKTILKYKLDEKIDLRLGSGLETIENEEVSTVIIAGMGGSLIKSILAEGEEELASVQRLILQPNIGEETLRQWLITRGYTIVSEEILEENNKIYEIIIADKTKDEKPAISDKEIFFGPHLLREKSKTFQKKWSNEKEKLKNTLRQMKQGEQVKKEKIHEFEEKLLWIEEVLKGE